MVQLFVLLTHVQTKDKMIKSESENKIELKRRDMRKTRKKLNTLTNDQLVFGTSLCILERFIHMIHLYIFAHIPCSAYSMLRIFHAQERQSWGAFVCVAMYWEGHSQAREPFALTIKTFILFQARFHHNWRPLQDMWGSQWCANDQTRDRQGNYFFQTLPLYLFDPRATLRSCPPSRVCTHLPVPWNSSWGSSQSQSFLGRC